jgi:antitoxin (DNA-binding transcriptional repressor) of toxin-antitoxin stability system
MKTISTTNARKQISSIIDAVRENGEVFAIGRHNKPEVIIIKYPSSYSAKVNEITNINTYSNSFTFLESEPDLYSEKDLKKKYV